MRKRLPASFLLTFVFVFSGTGKEWSGIVPLHSTRADVERVLSVKALRCGGNICLYELGDKMVAVLYADEPTCRNDDVTTSWKVPRDTVIEITTQFKTPQPLSILDIDLTKCERVPDKELAGIVYSTNRAEGVEIETSGDTVRRITYFREEKDNKLRCPEKL